jgi:hypothetical protein
MALIRHLQRFPDVDWNWSLLSVHRDVNLKTLKTLSDRPWNWSLLSKNPKFVWMWVREFPEKPWDWNYLSTMDKFTWNWVREFPTKPWDWKILSERIVDMNTIKEFPDSPWNWYTLTLGDKTQISDILKNPNFPWRINELMFVAVDEEIIHFLRFYRSHYDFDAWSDHTSRTPWKLIKQNTDLPWNLYFLNIHSHDEFVEDDIHYLYENRNNLNWQHLSQMLDFKKIISKCLGLPWDFFQVSRNKSVSYHDVLTFTDCDWDYNIIQLDDEKKEWNAANVIKRFWKRAVTDPERNLCRKLLMKDLSEISICGNNIC